MSPVMAKGSLCMKGDPKNPKFIFLLCFYSYTFKLQSPSKYSPFDVIHLSRLFFHCSNQFWTHQFWCLLVLLTFFVSPRPHRQNVSLQGLFSSGKTKKNCWGWDWMHRGRVVLVKNCWTLTTVWAGVFVNHPLWMHTHIESLQKQFTEAECSLSQQRQLVDCTDGFLEHSPSQGSLYVLPGAHSPEDHSGIFGSPLI